MTFHVKFAERSLVQIEKIRDWIAEWSPTRAEEWENGLFDAAQSLTTMPRLHPLASEEDAFPGEIRELLFWDRQTAYRVIFGIRGDEVWILDVIHSLRGPN